MKLGSVVYFACLFVCASSVRAQNLTFTSVDASTSGISNRGMTGASIYNGSFFSSAGYLNGAVNGAGIQANGQALMNAIDVKRGDFNGDGLLDIAAISNDDPSGSTFLEYQLTIFYGLGDGSFSFPVVVNLGPAHPTALAVGDADSDGRSDFLIGETCPQVHFPLCLNGVLYINASALPGGFGGSLTVSGNSVQKIEFLVPLGRIPVSLAFADLDGVNTLDIAAAFSGGSVGAALSGMTGRFPIRPAAIPTDGTIGFPAVNALATGVSTLQTDNNVDLPRRFGISTTPHKGDHTVTFSFGGSYSWRILSIRGIWAGTTKKKNRTVRAGLSLPRPRARTRTTATAQQESRPSQQIRRETLATGRFPIGATSRASAIQPGELGASGIRSLGSSVHQDSGSRSTRLALTFLSPAFLSPRKK